MTSSIDSNQRSEAIRTLQNIASSQPRSGRVVFESHEGQISARVRSSTFGEKLRRLFGMENREDVQHSEQLDALLRKVHPDLCVDGLKAHAGRQQRVVTPGLIRHLGSYLGARQQDAENEVLQSKKGLQESSRQASDSIRIGNNARVILEGFNSIAETVRQLRQRSGALPSRLTEVGSTGFDPSNFADLGATNKVGEDLSKLKGKLSELKKTITNIETKSDPIKDSRYDGERSFGMELTNACRLIGESLEMVEKVCSDSDYQKTVPLDNREEFKTLAERIHSSVESLIETMEIRQETLPDWVKSGRERELSLESKRSKVGNADANLQSLKHSNLEFNQNESVE